MTGEAAPAAGPVAVDTTRSPRARLKPVPITAVRFMDAWWAPRIKTIRETTLPSQYRLLEDTGRLDNFRVASGRKPGAHRGIVFDDSDVYKWIEAASWAVADGGAPRLAHVLDMVVGEVAAAQQPDGYLNTAFMGDRAALRWSNLQQDHELYCAGHLFQAAVAHRRATGTDALLDVARRCADHLDRTFGPAEKGKREGVCGHPEVEMGLVELFRATGERRYLALAEYFVDARGRGLAVAHAGESPSAERRIYGQDHLPLRDQGAAVGHAVRALYLFSGAADLLAEGDDPALRGALDRLWASVGRRSYVTGGVGSRVEGEALGEDWELPNARAYAEACAAIASAQWAWRLLQLEGEARFADRMELTLYNAFLVGLGLDGESYFYRNPHEDDGHHRRTPWFECACCPPNVARTMLALPGTVYSRSAEGIWVHLYAMCAAEIRTPGGRTAIVNQYTNYPADGRVRIALEGGLDGTERFALFLRVPAWAAGATLTVNGAAVAPAPAPGAYARVEAAWTTGDEVVLEMPLPVRRLVAHPRVAGNAGRVALARGPLVFCAEAADHPGIDPRDLVLPRGADVRAGWRPDLLGGTVALSARGAVRPPAAAWADVAEREVPPPAEPDTPAELVWVPYALWANRTPGPMVVWMREA